MSTRRSVPKPGRYRYGLRRQLLLNLGLVVLVVWGLLSLVLTRAAYLRFMQERVRFIVALSEQIDHMAMWKYAQGPAAQGPQLWFKRDAKETKSVLWPTHGVLLLPKGEYHVLFGRDGPVIQKALVDAGRWRKQGSTFQLRQAVRGSSAVWERYKRLDERGQYFGTIWLTWDLSAARGEFFSYQGLLFLSLLLFGFLILFLSMSFLERRLIKPLGRLGDAIHTLSEGQPGDLSKEVNRRDELGDLARSFVEMEQILQEQADEREEHIAELATANDALARAQVELVQREKMATVGRLAAGVAHEVGNPLSAIMGYSDLLKGTKEWGEMEQDLVVRIQKETARIDNIIRDLLDYARPVTKIVPGAPHNAIKEALELLRLQPRFKQMSVTQHVPETLPLVRLSDQYLVQVLINLLLNAADACDGTGHVELTATVHHQPLLADTAPEEEAKASEAVVDEGQEEPLETQASQGALQSEAPPAEPSTPEKGFVKIVLADDGPGIAPDVLDRVFEPFVTTKAPGKGVGLGLALCYRWITESGGQLSAEEAPSGGALFRLELPIVERHESRPPEHVSETPDTTQS